MSEKQDKKVDAKAKPQSLLDRAIAIPEDEVMPWEEIVLPSQGAYYDGMVPDGRVSVRAMGIAAEKILATQRLAQSGQAMDLLFDNCVRFPETDGSKFNPVNLLVGDRIFLLYYIRGITYGNMYEFVVKCVNEDCGQASTHEYDLNLLSKTIMRPSKNIGHEPFNVLLPIMSKRLGAEFNVKVRMMRGYDLQGMLAKSRVRRVQSVGVRTRGGESTPATVDDTLEENLNMLIVEAGGDNNRRKIRQLLGKMHATDTSAIREFLRKNSPGIDTSIIVTCSSCSFEMTMELPITEGFFRPASSSRH